MFTQFAKSAFGAVQTARDYADTLANKFIVKPKYAGGIGGFIFDYEAEDIVTLHSEITDHYTETNDPIQDHVAHRPVRITLRGYIGELVKTAPMGLSGALDIIQNRLSQVPAYLGKYTPSQLKKLQGAVTKTQKAVNAIDQTIQRVNNIVGFFNNSQAPTKQATAYIQLWSLWKTNKIMIIDTPYGVFDKMVIETVAFIQEEGTKYWSDIALTLKEIRTVDIQVELSKTNRRSVQNQGHIFKGTTKGTPPAETNLHAVLFPK